MPRLLCIAAGGLTAPLGPPASDAQPNNDGHQARHGG